MSVRTAGRRAARTVLLVLGVASGWAAAVTPAAAAVCVPSGPQILRPGRLLTRLASDVCNPALDFRIRVPPGALELTFHSGGGFGNANLYARFAEAATDAAVLRSTSPTNLEFITVPNPQPGIWFVRLQGDSKFAGVKLLAEIAVDETLFEAGFPQTGIAETQTGRFRYFTFEVPPGTARVDIETDGGAGNADLYVQEETIPTEESFAAISAGATNKERVSIPSPQGGPFKVATYSSAPYSGLTLDVTIVPGGGCVASDTALCLQAHRFEVSVAWTNQHAGGASGAGHAVAGTDETGTFWFFDSANTELVTKVLDGRGVNGKFWFFWGGLTDVEYTITVTDIQTGASRSYRHPAGSASGGFDTGAF